jgi:ABC-2 type transport system ATP-binding protein
VVVDASWGRGEAAEAGSGDSLVVCVRGLTKDYGAVHAVRDVDLDVRRGECVGVLGPNGSGKTTVLETLEGYRRADSGLVRVLGENPAKAGAGWRERVGIVSQHSVSIPGLSVWEAIRHWASFYRAGRCPNEVIQTVGLEHKAGASVDSLSGGLRRRLEFALAIVGRPELLFLDEPTAGLDPVARRSFWDLIRALRGAGTTVLLATHYLDEAAQLADRLVVVAAGRVVASDTPDRLGGEMRLESVVRWREGGSKRELHTPDAAQAVAGLTARLGPAIEGLEVVRPSLEDAYVSLLGTLGGALPTGTNPAGGGLQ